MKKNKKQDLAEKDLEKQKKANSKEEKSEKSISRERYIEENRQVVLDKEKHEKNLKEKLENIIKEIEKSNYSRTSVDRLLPSLKISEEKQQAVASLENEFKDISSDKKSEEISYSGIKKEEQEKKYISKNYNAINSQPAQSKMQESINPQNFSINEARTQIIHQESNPWGSSNIDETKKYDSMDIKPKKRDRMF